MRDERPLSCDCYEQVGQLAWQQSHEHGVVSWAGTVLSQAALAWAGVRHTTQLTPFVHDGLSNCSRPIIKTT